MVIAPIRNDRAALTKAAAIQPTAIGKAKPPRCAVLGGVVSRAEVYAPTATKPETPTLKTPVCPHCTFSPRQMMAKLSAMVRKKAP